MPDGKLHPDKALLLMGWAREGLSDKQIAEEKMQVGYTTLKEWKKRFPSFAAALKSGQEVSDYAVENALYKRALGGDVTAMIFWLKNRKPAKWRDKPAASVNDEMLAKARSILGEVKSGID